jgi:hypothetical protein
VYWKIRSRDTTGVRTLPEAPLWRLERELARKDPRIYDYYKRPPATASTKKSRRAQRPLSVDLSGSRVPSTVLSPRKSVSKRETFSPRSTTFQAEPLPRRSSGMVDPPKRARSRARSASFDDRETEIRETMPHRREKDRAWWEGMGRR